MTKEIDLMENKEMRDNLVGRLDVLDKVGSLLLLDELQMATTEQVAKYFSTTVDTIKMCVSNNREEIELDGYKVYNKEEVTNLLTNNLSLKTKRGGFNVLDESDEIVFSGSNKGVALWTKRSILRLGMLLQDSEVANKVREELGLSRNTKFGLRKEIEFIIILERQLKVFGVSQFKRQHSQLRCGKYRIDLYLPEINVAIEYDENNHQHYTYEQQELRQQLIEEELGCRFIRVTDEEDHFTNSAKVIKELILHNLLK